MYVGIDFGTCYSFVSVVSGDSTVIDDLLPSRTGIPTKFIHVEGEDVFGENCDSYALINADELFENIKTKVKNDVSVIKASKISGGVEYTYGGVIKKFISYLLSEIEVAAKSNDLILDKEIEGITITAPVALDETGKSMMSEYKDYLRKMLVDIASDKYPKLTSNSIHVIEEPVAAAISWLNNQFESVEKKNEMRVLIFDLGGGTLDTSIVSYKNRVYTVEAKEGSNIGGNDWDLALGKYIKEMNNVPEILSPNDQYVFNQKITQCKIRLSENESVDYKIVLKEAKLRIEGTITRSEFETVTRSLLNKAMDTLQRTIDHFGRNYGAINKIVLVGGGCNMPQIKSRICDDLSDIFDESDVKIFDPSTAIANGAAINSRIDSDSGSRRGGRVINIATHTYGINMYPDETSDTIKIKNMIFKGDRYDCGRIHYEAPFYLTPMKGNSRTMSFEVYESDVSELECDKDGFITMQNGERPCGIKVIKDVPEEKWSKGKSLKYRVRLQMILDSDGVLKIILTDPEGNENECYTDGLPRVR